MDLEQPRMTLRKRRSHTVPAIAVIVSSCLVAQFCSYRHALIAFSKIVYGNHFQLRWLTICIFYESRQGVCVAFDVKLTVTDVVGGLHESLRPSRWRGNRLHFNNFR